MLISKNAPAVGDVTVLRLTSGEEVVGKVVETNLGAITITKPVVLIAQMVQMGPGQPPQAQLQFAPFMVGAEEADSFSFAKDRLTVAPLKARQDIASNYLQATTGLAMPAKPGLLKA